MANRGRRASATILNWLETNVYEYIPDDLHPQVRRTILDNVNDLSDVAIDLVKSDQGQINDYWVTELGKLHEAIRSLNGER